jgi:hypothetical protein
MKNTVFWVVMFISDEEQADSLLGLLCDPANGGDIFLKN